MSCLRCFTVNLRLQLGTSVTLPIVSMIQNLFLSTLLPMIVGNVRSSCRYCCSHPPQLTRPYASRLSGFASFPFPTINSSLLMLIVYASFCDLFSGWFCSFATSQSRIDCEM
jgi:predicted Na+-dependent transporter